MSFFIAACYYLLQSDFNINQKTELNIKKHQKPKRFEFHIVSGKKIIDKQ